MIRRSPPLQVGQQLWSLVRGGPGATSQRGSPMTDGGVEPVP
jgi:hypothetical protein